MYCIVLNLLGPLLFDAYLPCSLTWSNPCPMCLLLSCVSYTKKFNCNLFTCRAPRSSQELIWNACAFQDGIGIWKVGFWGGGGGGTGVPREKPLGAEYRTNNKLKPQSYEAGSRNWTRATLVGGECSNHCAIPAPLKHFHEPTTVHGNHDCFTRNSLIMQKSSPHQTWEMLAIGAALMLIQHLIQSCIQNLHLQTHPKKQK